MNGVQSSGLKMRRRIKSMLGWGGIILGKEGGGKRESEREIEREHLSAGSHNQHSSGIPSF